MSRREGVQMEEAGGREGGGKARGGRGAEGGGSRLYRRPFCGLENHGRGQLVPNIAGGNVAVAVRICGGSEQEAGVRQRRRRRDVGAHSDGIGRGNKREGQPPRGAAAARGRAAQRGRFQQKRQQTVENEHLGQRHLGQEGGAGDESDWSQKCKRWETTREA